MAGACPEAKLIISQRPNGHGPSCYGSIVRTSPDQGRVASSGRLRLRGLRFRNDFLVHLVGPLVCLSRLEPIAIADEAVTLGKHPELQREHDLRADIDV